MNREAPTGLLLFGEIGAGKSTVAGVLTELIGAERVSFADALREEAASMLAFAEGKLHDLEWIKATILRMRDPETKPIYRDFLRWLGPYRRDTNPDHWVNLWEKRILKLWDEADACGCGRSELIVADDTRYDNEVRRGMRLGMARVLVTRAGHKREHDTHNSETDWRKWQPDATIYNTGRDLKQLTWATKQAMGELGIYILT